MLDLATAVVVAGGVLAAAWHTGVGSGAAGARTNLGKEDRDRAARLRVAIEKLRPLHKKLGKPRPGDWLDRRDIHEPGQTFEQYLACRPVRPRGTRSTIYIQPLGDFTQTQRRIITLTADFMGRYFNTPVKVHKDLPLSVIPARARRVHPSWGDKQILSTYVLDSVLKPRLPRDAAAYIAFAVYQALPAQRESPRLRNLGYWFALSGVFNAGWLFCWHYNLFGLSVIVMLALLATLIASYQNLEVGLVEVGALERWAVDIPFGTYLGWVSVATIANVTSWLDWIAWDGFRIEPQFWAIIMLAIAALVGLAVALTRREAAFLLVLAWAFAGIAVKQAAAPLVAISAWVATAFVLGLVAFNFIRSIRGAPAKG